MYYFQQFETIRYFSDNIYTGKATINEAEKDQRENMADFNDKSRPSSKEGKKKREEILVKVLRFFMKVKNQLLMLSKVEYFQ